MTVHDPITSNAKVGSQPRAVGAANVVARNDQDGVTRLADLRQSGSMKLVFPKTHREGIEAVIVNTAGGITGGDRYDLRARVEDGATLTLTTQAAERAYRAQPDEVGRVTTNLSIGEGARLNWLPQELILFNNSALRRDLKVDIVSSGQFLMVEPVVFGRAAMEETLLDVSFQDRILITRDGRPLYIDGMDLHGNAADHLARPAVANGAGAMASLVMISPDVESHLSTVRALLPKTAGASMITQDTLVMRFLASDSFELRRTLVPVLDHLTRNTLPTSWRL